MSSDKKTVSSADTASLAYTAPADLVRDFASRGLCVLAPEDLGIDPEVHERLYRREKQLADAGQPVRPSNVPEVLEILAAPGLVDACNRLVGDHWAIVPFTHNASFTSGARDQHWHKDDNGPYNGKKQRHHQAVQIEMLYYPQAVTPQMGPTATVPYSHYWGFNHEENQDNFAGAEHLDFNYQIDGMERRPVSGPDSEYDPDDILHQRTAHDIRMRDAVTDTGWPLVRQLEAAPLRAGSVVLYSHNTFHRGNHRRDDHRTWKDNPRFMWRFWLYRTTEPAGDAPAEIDWNGLGTDPLTGADLSDLSDDVTAVWRYHRHWLHTGQAPPPRPTAEADARKAEAENLYAQLHAKGDAAEPDRIGAAYRLAAVGDTALAVGLLGQALYDERENVRRAATYGLIAVGPEATDTFLEAIAAPVKWVRKAGVYGLGDASPLTDEVLQAVAGRLAEDPSVYVRAGAAGTLGCLGRRAAATGVGRALVPACAKVLVDSLTREKNRPAMDRAQGRSIKFVRPTDDSDMCEGGGIDFGLERFRPVRSAVRENALWSLVILSSHSTEILGDALEPVVAALTDVVGSDDNVLCVGFAQDALNRLARLHPSAAAPLQSKVTACLKEAPVRPWEALVRGGLQWAGGADGLG